MGLVASNSASNGRAGLKRSGRSKSIPTPLPSSPSIGPTSNDTPTSQPSMEEFWNPLILSAVDSHARTFPLPESARDSKESERLFGRRCFDSFAKLNLDGSWAKTFQGFCQLMTDGSSETYSETWPNAGSMLSGECFLRQEWERLTSEDESSCWVGTPTVGDGQGTGRSERFRKGKTPSPNELSRMNYWPTPTVAMEAPNLGSNKVNGPRSLIQVAKEMWPTPDSSQRGTRSADLVKNGSTVRRRKSGQQRGIDLQTAVKFATPQARDWKGASGRSMKGEGSEDPSQIGGQLNPAWVEWLMGFPLGWTALNASEMPWSPRSRKKSGG